MLNEWQNSPCLTIRTVGKSIEGRDLIRIEITSPKKEIPCKKRWVHYVTNQHGAENNARWRIAGMINWLLSEEAAEVRERNLFHFAVMMNPDGPANGWPRTNAEGVDMNRTYRVCGADKTAQTHEGYVFQKDLEDLMDSDESITSMWNMHNCTGDLFVYHQEIRTFNFS